MEIRIPTLRAARLFAACLLAAGFGLGGGIAAADDSLASGAAARPRVGLVLAGGGAKGGAHVGVLKVLEELRIPVDCIAGTSMGALVGGGYAAGLTPAEMEKFLLGVNWQRVVGGRGQRELEPIEQKRAGVTYSNSLELGLKDSHLQMPAGIVDTNNIENLLRQYVATARKQPDFDRLPIPFRAVATDMVSGEMVVLSRGDLATALRASMAIPGAFAPVVTDEYILSDGGMVRNIPVDVARELCADVVIVVNLVEIQPTRETLQTASQLLARSSDVMFEVNEKVQLATLTPQDILIDVEVGDIGTADFERIPETLPLGERAAKAAEHRLRELSVPPAQFAAWRKRVSLSQDVEVRVADIRYEGLERVNIDYLKQGATVRIGDVVDSESLSAEAQRMAVLQDIESVGYRLEGDADRTTLVWLPLEKGTGPDYLKLDLGMYVSTGGDVAFNIYGEHRRTWLNPRGGEWRNEVQLGRASFLKTSLYQAFDVSQRFFVEPQLFAAWSDEDIFYDGDRVAKYKFGDLGGRVELGANLGHRFQARLGYLYTRRSTRVETGLPQFPEKDATDAGITLGAIYDSRDSRFGPTKGMAVALEYVDSDDSLGADRDWQRAELGLGLALPVFERDVWWITAAGGSKLNGKLPPDRAFTLGGPSSFPGYELGELRVNGYWTVGTSYLWKFRDIASIRGDALYAGLGLQAARTYDRVDTLPGEDIYGASIFLRGRTIVGPLTVGLGGTTTDVWSLWVAVGRPVGHGTILEHGIFR